MEQYTASNGVQVLIDSSGYIDYTTPGPEGYADDLDSEAVEGLREFFQAEEDERLGRWRWPENPEYVVYPTTNDRDLITVLRESVGRIRKVRRYSLELIDDHAEQFAACAEAYFDAHPEPKPWHDAKPGEVWELTFRAGSHAWFVNGDFFQSTQTLTTIYKNDPGILSARRIWPEES
jgi:hypothetical protein